jgi:hypothetical protein
MGMLKPSWRVQDGEDAARELNGKEFMGEKYAFHLAWQVLRLTLTASSWSPRGIPVAETITTGTYPSRWENDRVPCWSF